MSHMCKDITKNPVGYLPVMYFLKINVTRRLQASIRYHSSNGDIANKDTINTILINHKLRHNYDSTM